MKYQTPRLEHRTHTEETPRVKSYLPSGRLIGKSSSSCCCCGSVSFTAAFDDSYYSYYAYDHSGGSCGSREQSQACLNYAEMEQRRRSQRRLKLTVKNSLLDVNAEYMATYAFLDNPTLYPSAYLVLTNKGYTKHYYAGAERVAARLGNGSTFCVDDMELRYNKSGAGNWNTQMNLGGESQFVLTATDKYLYWEEPMEWNSYQQHGSYEATVENIISSVVYHEWNGHFINKYHGAGSPEHVKCYEASKSSPYFSKTTDRYQNYINHMINRNTAQ